jgi:hypothetical protein
MRREAPAAARNRQPILDVLRPHLPAEGLVLEVASGSGEHTMHFAAALPSLSFQPSDPSADARASIDAWTETLGLNNVQPAIDLDAASQEWPIKSANAIVCINMIHISPWQATLGLVAGAARLLPRGGLLYTYGPYHRDGRPTAPSNADFDADLRRRDPAWGIRNLEDIVTLATSMGFDAPTVVEMPANNLSLLFRRGRVSSLEC